MNYQTVQGDAWDLISFKQFGNEYFSDQLMVANPLWNQIVNFDDQTIMQTAVFPEDGIDILIMECTRGDHATPLAWSRESAL